MLNQSDIKLIRLPDWYTEVQLFHLLTNVPVPHCSKPVNTKQVEDTILLEDKDWLQNLNLPSCAVFYSQSQPSPLHQDTSAMLPEL